MSLRSPPLKILKAKASHHHKGNPHCQSADEHPPALAQQRNANAHQRQRPVNRFGTRRLRMSVHDAMPRPSHSGTIQVTTVGTQVA